MPRKARILSPTGIYHVTLRSVNQHIIFEEDADYLKFLFFLSEDNAKFDTDIYAYCIMDNHIHILLYAPPEQLSSFFQSLGTRFARWYNKKYSRSGHLFQERFYSVAVCNNGQYLAELSYILANPCRAMICRFPSDYRWSSFNAFYGKKDPLINTTYSYMVAGSKHLLHRYFSENMFSENADSQIGQRPPVPSSSRPFVSDEKALTIFKELTSLSTTSEVSSLPKLLRNKYMQELFAMGLTQKQIARLMDLSLVTVKRHTKQGAEG